MLSIRKPGSYESSSARLKIVIPRRSIILSPGKQGWSPCGKNEGQADIITEKVFDKIERYEVFPDAERLARFSKKLCHCPYMSVDAWDLVVPC